MTLRVDFTSQEYLRDPAAALRSLRACGPLVQTKFPIIGKVWITTTQEMAGRVLKDSQTFTLRKNGAGPAGLRWWMPPTLCSLANNMLTVDEPDHARLRQSSTRLSAAAPSSRWSRASLPSRTSLPASCSRRAAQRISSSATRESCRSHLRAARPAARRKFIAWANRVGRIAGPVGLIRLVAGLWDMKRYLEQRLEVYRQTGGEGLIAELVRVEAEGGRISGDEMVAMVFLLLGAGSETTTHLISGSKV